jgi:hypothetical protein
VPFSLPTGLADACFDRLGADPPVDGEGAAHLLDRMAVTVPTGSTAKLEAIAADLVPPGADPVPVAETWLVRPGLAWSCWAVSTLYAALVARAGTLTADVLGARRVDPASVPVDFHSVVEVRSGARRWLTDPYFWMAPVEEPVGDALRPGMWGEAVADGPVWRTAVGSCAGRNLLRYRTFTTPLTGSDVEGLCRVSVTHTGVASRARAQLATADGMVAASAERDGAVRLRRWRAGPAEVWGVPCGTVELDRWADAEVILGELARGTRPGGDEFRGVAGSA